MKWGHFSDTHLGYRQYGLKERMNDFYNSARTCAELIIKQEPDFVIFAGDLFENFRPLPVDYRSAFELLKLFKKKDIPVYAIRGNHDASYAASKRYGGDVLDFLHDINLITYVQDEVIIAKKGEKDLAIIAGLGYYGKRTSKRLQELLNDNKVLLQRQDLPKILMIHAFVEGMVPDTKEDVKMYFLSQLPFDYIAIGHYHQLWPSDFDKPGNKFFCSGSTEHWSAGEWDEKEGNLSKGSKKGFYTVEAEKNGSEWKIRPSLTEYPVRPKFYAHYDLKFTNPKKIRSTIKEFLDKYDKKDHLLKMNLRGQLKRGDLALLNMMELKDMANNALYFDLITQFMDSSYDIERGLSTRDAIIDILRKNYGLKNEDLDEYTSLIEDILSIVNDKEFSSKSIERIKASVPKMSVILGDDLDDKPKKKTTRKTKVKKIKRSKKKSGSKTKKSLEGFI
ncbi:MAG: metallophosphoesterase family protein [Candidatus Helarchaeota archaeon]